MASRRAIAGALEASLTFTPAGNTAISAQINPIWIDNRSVQIEELQFNLHFLPSGNASAASTPVCSGALVWMVLCQQNEFNANAAANTPVLTVSNWTQSDVWPAYSANPSISDNTVAYSNNTLLTFVNRFASLVFAVSIPTQTNFQMPPIKIPAKQRESYLVIGVAPYVQGYIQATTDGTAIAHLGYAGVMYEP